jgi:hypothetical protein
MRRIDQRTSPIFIDTAFQTLAGLRSPAKGNCLFAAGVFEGGDVLESADGQRQIEFGEEDFR